jgi:DNA transformation protein
VTPIERAVNIGPVLSGELRQAGIETIEQLQRVGYVKAWRRIHAVNPERDCTHAMLALAGAIQGVRWTALPADVRADIRSEAQQEALR